jgi:hypothetical protein
MFRFMRIAWCVVAVFSLLGSGLAFAASGEEGGAQIWRSKDGLAWEPVSLEGLLSANDVKIDGLDVYDGELYAHTVNWTDGSSVFRTKDAITWERVNEPGWGNSGWSASA